MMEVNKKIEGFDLKISRNLLTARERLKFKMSRHHKTGFCRIIIIFFSTMAKATTLIRSISVKKNTAIKQRYNNPPCRSTIISVYSELWKLIFATQISNTK